jgi:hypothetical protein
VPRINSAFDVCSLWVRARSQYQQKESGLRCGALTAPFVIDGPMDPRIFETYVETQLVPTLRPGNVVVLGNLPAHKSAAAEQAVRAMGACLLFLPP